MNLSKGKLVVRRLLKWSFILLPAMLVAATLTGWGIGLTGPSTIDLSPIWGRPSRTIAFYCHDPELVSPCAVIEDYGLLLYVHTPSLKEPTDVRFLGLYASHSPICYANSPNYGLAVNLISIAWWMPLTIFAIPPIAALLIRRPIRQRQRRKKGLCIRCGYDLMLNESGICPECGTAIPRQTQDRRAMSR